jgi:uncharacterized protein YggE
VRDLATAERRPTRRDAARPQAVAGAHGDVVLVREQVTPPSGPFPMTAGDMAASSEAVPIAPGSSDVTVTVDGLVTGVTAW